MKQESQIHIVYKSYIPEEWITEVKEVLAKNQIEASSFKQELAVYGHFEDSWITDVWITVKEIAEGEIQELLKQIIVNLFKNLLTKKKRKIRSGGHETQVSPRIAIRHQYSKGKFTEINIEGNHDPEVIERIVDSGLRWMDSIEIHQYFTDQDLVRDRRGIKVVEAYYNEESGLWKPLNFRKREEELREKIRKDREGYNN